MESKQVSKRVGLTCFQCADFEYDFFKISLRRAASNTDERRSRRSLCERVIRREATETEGLVVHWSARMFLFMLLRDL